MPYLQGHGQPGKETLRAMQSAGGEKQDAGTDLGNEMRNNGKRKRMAERRALRQLQGEHCIVG